MKREGTTTIKYFSVLYAGHVLEGDGVGFAGTPANERWYPNERFVRTFDIAKEIAQPIVSGTQRAFDFMAQHGMKGVILGTAAEYVDNWTRAYQEANARYGRPLQLGENLALGLWCYGADTHEQAKRALQPLFEEHVKFAAPLGMLRYRQEQMRQLGPTGVARHIAAGVDYEDVLAKKAWFCGIPDETVAYLKELEEKYPGLEHIMLGLPFGASAAELQEQLRRFAQEVMPAFRQQAVPVGG